jgi:signal transduction histidine kinase
LKIKLLYKFIIVFVLVAVIPLSFVGYKTVEINQEALRNSTRTNHINTAKYLADRVDVFIGALREKLLFLIKSQSVAALDFNGKQVLIRSLLSSSDYFITVSMLNSSGEEYIKTYHPDYEGEAAFFKRADTDLFNRAKTSPAVSEVYYRKGNPRMDIIYPLEKSFIFITITLNNIWDDIKNTDIGSKAAVFLVDEDGKVLAHPDSGKEGKKLDIPPVRAVLDRTGIGTMDFNYDGVETVSAFAPVKSMGWGIVTEQPFKYAYASIIRVKKSAYRWIIITVLLVGFVAYLFARRLSGPILKLTKGAKAVAAGDFTGVVKVRTRDELNILAETFNEMVKSLKKYRELHIDKIMEERTKTKAIIFSIDDGILLTDYDGYVMLANDRAKELLNLTENIKEGRHIDEYIKRKKTDGIFKDLKESELDLSDGENNKFVKVFTDEVTTAGGKKIGKVKVIRDITLEKEIEDMKEKFMQSITHDLKNPLSAIMGMADLVKLKRGKDIGKEEKNYLNVLKAESERLMGMINDILNLAKIESGNMEIQKNKFNINELLESTKITFTAQAQNSNINLKVKKARTGFEISADKKLIKRVVINLLGNALKYTPREGTITLGAKKEDGFLKVYVKDTGQGLPPDMSENIFDRFKQIKGHSMGGTGIGLNVSKEIALAHGGRIWVDSESGEGSVFSFTLPYGKNEV